ncbi:MAG: DUF4412 domain-containing protein [Candidatus Aminicenantes bacterium]|nr:DUF4412 domain-containing protein [Candidatus Aminicenantes bacterium]
MKHKKILSFTSIFLFLTLILFPVLAKADTHVKRMVHMDAFMGQPASDEELSMWLAKDKFRYDALRGMTQIVRFDKKKLYMINHNNQSYSEIDLPIDLTKALDPQAQQMMGQLQTSVTVTDTGETQKIGNWNCNKYKIEVNITMMMSMTIEMDWWVSKDVGSDLIKLYQKHYGEVLDATPMMADLVEEIKKVKGFPIKTESSMMGMSMTDEVFSIEKKKAPAGTYDVPAGYTKAAYNPFMQR